MAGFPIRLKSLVGVVLTMCASGCASMGNYSPLKPIERSMIYHPSAWPEELELPSDSPFEDAWFVSGDGTKLHGVFIGHPEPQAVALVCHGNAGNVAGRMETLAILNREHRLSVLMFDYRGFGRSEGKPTETGILADARAARKWLSERAEISEDEIVVMGRSLGGAVAVDLAAKDGAKALVLASTFTSLPEVAREHFRWLPAQWLMTERLDSINKLQNYHGPLLQTHGTTDSLVPIELGRKLFDTAPGPKRFIEVEGGHNAPQPEEYRNALDDLLQSL